MFHDISHNFSWVASLFVIHTSTSVLIDSTQHPFHSIQYNIAFICLLTMIHDSYHRFSQLIMSVGIKEPKTHTKKGIEPLALNEWKRYRIPCHFKKISWDCSAPTHSIFNSNLFPSLLLSLCLPSLILLITFKTILPLKVSHSWHDSLYFRAYILDSFNQHRTWHDGQYRQQCQQQQQWSHLSWDHLSWDHLCDQSHPDIGRHQQQQQAV